MNVIILNNETFPPQADITYESFFDSAIHGTDSSRMTPETSLAIKKTTVWLPVLRNNTGSGLLNTHRLQKSPPRKKNLKQTYTSY